MKTVEAIPLILFSVGCSRHLTVVRYVPDCPSADNGSRPAVQKVYIQAGLHADELAGPVVLHRLIDMLDSLNADGRIHAEIVLVPLADPIGLSQELLGAAIGRFCLATGANFNRGFPFLVDALLAKFSPSPDVDDNTLRLRRQGVQHLEQMVPKTEMEDLQRHLLRLAFDADVVVDLHTDDEALLHMYTSSDSWGLVEPLAAELQPAVILIAEQSAAESELPFDEACSYTWLQIRKRLGPNCVRPVAATTVELRGSRDVSEPLAVSDAEGILRFLRRMGAVVGAANPDAASAVHSASQTPSQVVPHTSLRAVDMVKAPVAGIILLQASVGQRVEKGAVLATILDPTVPGHRGTPVSTVTSGLVFATTSRRLARPGTVIAKVAGPDDIRTATSLLTD